MAGTLISTHISRASAVVLLIGGMALLFASDAVLPRLVPGFPPGGAWLGQLLGAGWLAVSVLNWHHRSAVLGGIYGRPVVSTNAMLYFVSAMSLVKVVGRESDPALWAVFVPTVVFAGIYAWLMFRGPFEQDLDRNRP